MNPIYVLALVAVIALIPAYIAQRKGHSFWSYYLFGLVMWILAVPFAIFAKDARPKCPDCREVVDAEAIRCPHCQADISGRVIFTTPKKPFEVAG